MGFLDNSGDIILDAVLTDHGRKLLAKGDGSFRIAKYALGDEEINYELFKRVASRFAHCMLLGPLWNAYYYKKGIDKKD